MRRKLAIATFAILPMTASISLASDESVGIIKANSLNVRSGPSTSDSVLFTVKKGEKVHILESSNGWYKIKTSNNKYGWASGKYIDIDNKEQLSLKKKVNVDGLNMRSGPSTSYRVIKVLEINHEVEVISEFKGWSKIKSDGRLGYVATKYLNNLDQNISNNNQNTNQINIKKQVHASSLNVRSGPSTSNGVVGSLKRNEIVVVLSETNGWSKIKYNNKEAYVSSKYLKSINENSINKPSIEPPKEDSSIESNSKYVINYKSLNYTLEQHVEAQYKRSSVGGNMIHSSIGNRSAGEVEVASLRQVEEVTTEATVYLNEVSENNLSRASSGFVPASKEQIRYYLNPSNFTASNQGMMQFLRIDNFKDGITESELNNYLNNLPKSSSKTNVFYNKASAFLNSAKKYNIDVVYLVSHAMWETGYGTSSLAKGQTITSYKGKKIPKTTVYNFFGIGAIDKSANVSGAEAAYSNGWTSVEKAIDGAAKWISENYIKNSKYNQNTIYKMRFNYDYTWHQYATDVNWANGISKIMLEIIKMYDDSSNLRFEIPNYK